MKVSELQAGDYNSYYQPYIDVLGEVELMDLLRNQSRNFPEFIQAIPDSQWQYRYGLDKWTVAEVLVHLLDAERVFQYRALRIARGDSTPLPGFDENAYVPNSHANDRSKDSVIEEYRAVRSSTIQLFASFGPEVLRMRGTASNSPVSVGALGFLIAGHQKHHRNIIRERYLV